MSAVSVQSQLNAISTTKEVQTCKYNCGCKEPKGTLQKKPVETTLEIQPSAEDLKGGGGERKAVGTISPTAPTQSELPSTTGFANRLLRLNPQEPWMKRKGGDREMAVQGIRASGNSGSEVKGDQAQGEFRNR